MACSGARATKRCSRFVGREGYVDPACDFEDAPFDGSTPHGASTSGSRRATSGSAPRPGRSGSGSSRTRASTPRPGSSSAAGRATRASCPTIPQNPDSRLNRLWDGSVEPPVRIGMACGACHIAYDPANPPADPDHPAWENIDALVGNQYSRISNLLGNGLSPHRLEWQLIARSRPGIVDTSALPMDYVSNPGTMNAIINFAQPARLHEEEVLKWRKAASCEAGADPRACWCEPGREGKCWLRSIATEQVPHMLKGGEDFDRLRGGGPAGLLQHRIVRRAVLGQPPDRPARRRSRAAQLRSDAVRHRPVSARLRLVPGDRGPARRSRGLLLHRAAERSLARRAGLGSAEELEVALDAEYFPGAVERGRQVFAANCARCHSSQPGPYETTDFLATDPADEAAARLARQRRGGAGVGDRHLCGAGAALEPHAGPGVGRVRVARRPACGRRPDAARGDEGRRARLLPQHLAA